jgi:hypothetical protein
MPEEMNKELVRAVKKGASLVKRVKMGKVKEFTGSTAQSIGSLTRVKGIGSVRAQIGPKTKEGKDAFVIMEKGRDPGAKKPWIHDLTDWVGKKWGLSGNEVIRGANRLAISIHLKGTEGTPIRPSVLQETHTRVTGFIQTAVNKIIEKMVVK